MEDFIREFEPKIRENKKNLIFVCIGSNKVVGDSFGPMVGSKLKKIIKNNKCLIIGDMNCPLNRQEISKNLNGIVNTKNTIIAIDSAIGTKEIIGHLFVKKGTLEIASGVNKNGLIIGDITIKAVTSISAIDLINTPVSLIDDLSQTVAEGIYKSIL